MSKTRLQTLHQRLGEMDPGPVAASSGIDSLLSDCWNLFEGSDFQSTTAYKLDGRMEDIYWTPPVLSFRIERHGGTVLGSTRAEMHRWEVNIDTMQAHWSQGGHRQLYTQAKKFVAGPCADEVAGKILAGEEREGLKWLERGAKVQVTLSRIIPDDGFRQTQAGRSRRLRQELCQRLTAQGWREIGTNRVVYEKTNSEEV